MRISLLWQQIIVQGNALCLLKKLMNTRYSHSFTDDEIVQALKDAKAQGASRQFLADRVQPPNLCAFLNNLPTPERDRLIELAWPKGQA